MRYEIWMTNGDHAEANTLAGALLAAKTMWDDNGGWVSVETVAPMWALKAVRQHVQEQRGKAA